MTTHKSIINIELLTQFTNKTTLIKNLKNVKNFNHTMVNENKISWGNIYKYAVDKSKDWKGCCNWNFKSVIVRGKKVIKYINDCEDLIVNLFGELDKKNKECEELKKELERIKKKHNEI